MCLPDELLSIDGIRVFKFGGSSLATPERIQSVARIVLNRIDRAPAIVVVSAFQGVTDQLLECARLAEHGGRTCQSVYEAIALRHRATVDALFDGGLRSRIRARIEEQLVELHEALAHVSSAGRCSPGALDVAASFGERLSALIVSACLSEFVDAHYVDARQLVTTDDDFTRASVIVPKTNDAIRRFFASFWRHSRSRIPIVTGFIARTEDGRTTTIGRNGSDYTAAIIGGAVGASAIEIWTDVDGVLSADPKAVASAFALPHITYDEAADMSHFGAKVLHAATIGPAVAHSIPIVIKNSFNPAAPGTLISRRAASLHRPATGLASIGSVTLLTLRGRSPAGVERQAERLFRALASTGVDVILSNQASCDRTLSLAVQAGDAAAAAKAIRREFRTELRQRAATLHEKRNQAILALVGARSNGRTDVAGALFSALERHRIPVRAIARGASGRNITCVVDESQERRALNIIHQRVFETRKSLALAVVGVGNVGGALLRQLSERQRDFFEQGLDVKVVAVADSRRFVVRPDGIDLRRWREELEASRDRMIASSLARELASLDLTNGAFVDCTAAASVVDAYPEFIKANLHIVTPNKRANTLPWPRYVALKQMLASHAKSLLCETNVGAGLPVMTTLRDLMASGDRITKVEGILSGTLSYLFNTFDGAAPFSAVVRDAHQKGYTEPDPRDDLSGEDVARKLLILARQIGLRMDLEDVGVQKLVPQGLAGNSFSPQFFTAYAAHDAEMHERVRCASARGSVVRYVARLENGRARAELTDVPRDHPFAATRGTDNVVAFTTKRYSMAPLILQGPGAGADVTAAGVLSDVVRLMRSVQQ